MPAKIAVKRPAARIPLAHAIYDLSEPFCSCSTILVMHRREANWIYEVKGVVQYSVSDKPQMVVINTSEDGKSRPVLVRNYTKTTWKVGEYYRIFADAYSTYNSMPWLNARYTY